MSLDVLVYFDNGLLRATLATIVFHFHQSALHCCRYFLNLSRSERTKNKCGLKAHNIQKVFQGRCVSEVN